MSDIQASAVLVQQFESDVAFRSWRQVERWIDEVIEGWAWISAVPGSDPAQIKAYLPSHLSAAKQEVLSAISNQQPLTDVSGIFARHMSSNYTPPHPKTDKAKLIFEIRDHAGPEAAMFAFGLHRNLLSYGNVQSNEHWRGLSLALNPEIMISAGDADRFKRERSNYRGAAEKMFDDISEREAVRALQWKSVLEDVSTSAVSWSKILTRRLLRTSLKSRARERNAMNKLYATDAAFTEMMGLKAPVKYWKDKAIKHGEREFWARLWVIAFFVVTLPSMAFVFVRTGVVLIDHAMAIRPQGAPPFPNAVFIIASAGLASCAGLVFWAGRLLTKLYLSQHHLRQDADERATMTETYLALIENSAASAEDRQVVLNALFRNTPDGIVKEEGGLDPSIAAALGKFLAKP